MNHHRSFLLKKTGDRQRTTLHYKRQERPVFNHNNNLSGPPWGRGRATWTGREGGGGGGGGWEAGLVWTFLNEAMLLKWFACKNIGFIGVLFFMLNWMFQHDCLDTYCFWVSDMHGFFYFYICTCSAQLSMFHMEKRSRNTLIIIIIIIKNRPQTVTRFRYQQALQNNAGLLFPGRNVWDYVS